MTLVARTEDLFRKLAGDNDGAELYGLLNTQIPTVDGGDTFSVDPKTSVGVGAKNGSAVSAVENGNGAVHKTVLTLTNLSVTMTDATTNGCHGAHKVYDFPEGPIQILGCSYNLTTARVGTNITATAALVGSLGSATNDAANATLTSTEADLIASTTGTLTAGAGTLKKHGSVVTTAFDGTATPVDAFLNLSIPDAGSAGNDAITVNGTITILWANLGDY